MIAHGLKPSLENGRLAQLTELWEMQFRLLGWRRRLRAFGDNDAGTLLWFEAPHPSDSGFSVFAVRHPRVGGRAVRGSTLEWVGPGAPRRWTLSSPLAATRVRGGRVWAKLDGVPIVACARDQIITCGLDPADVRAQPALSAVLRRVLRAAQPGAAWLDVQSVVGLRMDDPGASSSVHLEPWSYDRLGARAWEEIGSILERHDARMSVAYTPGWVDDGDPIRGELLVAGNAVERVPGRVHPSPLVHYVGKQARSADCATEFEAVRALRNRGICEIELHGYTHVHPDLERWAAAPGRHHKLGWYRELGVDVTSAIAARGPDRHPVTLGLELMREHIGEPTALVCPGNTCSNATLQHAHELGLQAVASTALALRGANGFSPVGGVVSVPLDGQPEAALATEGLVIGCFHDRDVAVEGVEWLGASLTRWRAAGARRFVDIRELTSALNLELSFAREGVESTVRIQRHGGTPLPRPFPALIQVGADVPREVALTSAAGTDRLEVEQLGGGLARVHIPAGV